MPVPGFNRPGDGGGGLKLGDKLNFVNNLVAKSQPSTMADSVQTLINKVANLGYVGSKRWASGTVTSSSTTASFNAANGSVYGNLNYITVSGLTFKPSVIHYARNASGTSDGGFYDANNTGDAFPNSVRTYYNETGGTTSGNFFDFSATTGAAYVNNGGFQLPIEVSGSFTYTWYAVE